MVSRRHMPIPRAHHRTFHHEECPKKRTERENNQHTQNLRDRPYSRHNNNIHCGASYHARGISPIKTIPIKNFGGPVYACFAFDMMGVWIPVSSRAK